MYSLVKDNQELKTKNFGTDTPPALSQNKGKWVPRIVEAAPSYDDALSYLEESIVVTETEVTASYSVIPKTDEVLAAELEAKNAAERAALKMSGIAFTDVTGANTGTLMLSAMADDQFGLESVRRNVMAGLEFNYKFENGTVMVLNSANFDNLEAVWLPFRASFF